MAISPTISRACAAKLLHSAMTNQGDPLGYHAFGGPADDTNEDGVDQSTEGDREDFVIELAGDALGGGQPGVVAHVTRTSTSGRMDPVTAALLTHMGIVPGVAMVLRDTALEQNVALDIVDADDEDHTSRAIAHHESWELALDLARGTHWSSEGTLNVDPMPETLATAAAGRPLREIVSHPALDGMDLAVERIETGPARSIVTLAGFAEGAMETLNAAALERMRRAAMEPVS